MTKRSLFRSLDGLVDAMLEPADSRKALMQERLPPPLVAQLADVVPEPLPGRYLAAAPLNTTATDRLFKVALKDGSAVLVHVVFADKVTDGSGLAQAVEAWRQAITEQWLIRQPAELRHTILGIQPLIIKYG